MNDPADEHRRARSESRDADRRPLRLLIADDEPLIREALADLFGGEDSIELVAVAADAGEAIELAGRTRPDVALLDVKMPGGGGPRAAREIRSLSPLTHVVALSAHEDRASVVEMRRAGVAAYVVKGAPAAEIVEAVRRWGSSNRSAPPAARTT